MSLTYFPGTDKPMVLGRLNRVGFFTNSKAVTTATDAFTLDVQPPRLEASVENIPFTPDDDGNKDTLEIDLNAEDNFGIESWKVTIVDPKGNQFHRIQGSNIPEEPNGD